MKNVNTKKTVTGEVTVSGKKATAVYSSINGAKPTQVQITIDDKRGRITAAKNIGTKAYVFQNLQVESADEAKTLIDAFDIELSKVEEVIETDFATKKS